MKINFKNTRLFRNLVGSKEYNQEEEYYIHPFAPREKTEVEFLPSYPPKLRIHGQVIPCPQELTIQDLYDQCMERDANILEKTIPTEGEQDNPPKELHPLRRQHLKNRLVELAYKERQQANQDDFTTRMYGKKDYATERKQILEELGQKDNTSKPTEQSKRSDSINFIPAPPDEDSPFDKRKELWENLKKLENRKEQQELGKSVLKNPEQNAFERLNIPDPKQRPESILNSEKEKWNFYQFPHPKGTTTENWEMKNEQWRNTPRKDKNGNIIGSELRCNTTIGRELSKLGIDVEKDTNMNGIIDSMDKSGDWANLPTDSTGKPDHDTALKLAQEGYIVAATEKGEGHGHAVLLTGGEQNSGTWNRKVPEVYGSVNGKSARTSGISSHWKRQDQNKIQYKIYRYKRPI